MTTQHGRAYQPARRRRFLATGSLITAIALLVAACGSGSSGGDSSDAGNNGVDGDAAAEEATLRFAWWGDASRADRYQEAIALFEEAHPGVQIQPEFGSWGDYWGARSTEVAGGGLPDVLQMDIAYITEYGNSGRLGALDEYLDAQIDMSGYLDSVLPAGQIDGTTFALTTSTNTFATFMNENMLDEVGVDGPTGQLTWAQFHTFLGEVAAAGADHDPAIYGAVDYTQVFWLFQMWLGQQGLAMFTDDGELGFTEADLERWWAQPQALRGEAFMPVERQAQLEGVDALASGQAVADLSWDNFLVRFSEGSGGEDMYLLPIPIDDPAQPGLFLKPSLMLAMAAESDHPEIAAEFIDFIVNDPQVSEIFGTSRGVPVSQPALDALPDHGLDGQILEYQESIADLLQATPPPPASGFGTMEEAFVRIHEDLAYGVVTPGEAASQWFVDAEAAMNY